ncbi:dihydrodipicolinate synthase family protein [Leucobacter sp. GX24907]
MARPDANLTGIFAAIPTPFTADGSALDEAALRDQIERMVESGISGVVPTGTTGEFFSLSDAEYREALRLNVEAAAGRIKVIAGVGSTSTAGAVEYVKYSEEIGADAVMVVPPFYDPLSFDALKTFLQRISEATSLNIMYYNVPGATGIHLNAAQLAEIGAIDGVNYFKDTSGDAPTFTEVLVNHSESITAFNGWDTLTFLGLALGAKGSVWGVASIAPKHAAELWQALAVEKDLDRGRELWAPLWKLSAVLESINYPAGIKAAIELTGHPVGPVREPLLPLSDEERALVADALDGLGLLA